MKIDRLETHDRLLHFKQDQAINIFHGVDDCMKKNPLSLALQDRSPYIYIFAHPRTADDGVTKRMLFQPRLTRPRVETNSYLFRAASKSDIIEVCWLIPPMETWSQYQKGKVTESEEVRWSIHQYVTKKQELETAHPEDLSDERARSIYMEIAKSSKPEKYQKI
jgi:hypothetical protein